MKQEEIVNNRLGIIKSVGKTYPLDWISTAIVFNRLQWQDTATAVLRHLSYNHHDSAGAAIRRQTIL
jgi:hypothetical protein